MASGVNRLATAAAQAAKPSKKGAMAMLAKLGQDPKGIAAKYPAKAKRK